MTKHTERGRHQGSGGDEDHPRPVQPDAHEQSGSTGRHSGDGPSGVGKDTGQDRYGQNGVGGGKGAETAGQASYRESDDTADPDSRSRSNPGSGRADHEDEEYRGEQAGKQTGRKVTVDGRKPRG